MIYGKTENYRAKRDIKAGELIQLGTRGAVACCDIAKGETGPVCVRGDFFFDCDDDYECDDTALKRVTRQSFNCRAISIYRS